MPNVRRSPKTPALDQYSASELQSTFGRGRFLLGSFSIGRRSSEPSENILKRKRSSPSSITSILIGFFGIAQKRQNEMSAPPY